MCSRDRRTDLARALESIRASLHGLPEIEIVIVEETDAPRPIPGTVYVPLPRHNRGFGFARNVGVARAKAEIVVFVDDDCEVGANWLSALTLPLRSDPRLLGAAGAVLVRDCNLIGYAENIIGFPGGGLRYLHQANGRPTPTRYLSTCNCAYRREAILQAGGFPEDAQLGGEDYLLAERVASLGACVFTPDAIVYHRPRGRLPAVFRWFMRRGESEIMLLHATTAARTFRWYLLQSSWTVRLILLMALLAWWPQLAILLPPAGILYYGLILWRFRFARAYPSHRRAWWLVPIVKVTMDLGAELGRWRGLLLRGRQ